MARLEDLCSKSDGQAKEVSGGCVQWVCPLCLNVVKLIFSYSIHVWVWPRVGRGLDTGAEGNEADV